MDEPTNFLDRSALGGLAVAIKNWDGAFVCISHNEEFVGALCPVSSPEPLILSKYVLYADSMRFIDFHHSYRRSGMWTPGI